jgi:hypothetical protein
VTSGPQRRGAWGWQWHGFDDMGTVLNAAPATWPDVAVRVSCGSAGLDGPTSPPYREATRATFTLRGGGTIDIHADPRRVHLRLPRPVPPECVAQPHLASAAATFGTWAGFGVLHGGAFVYEGRAWALLGDKGRGKSTTLAELAIAGCAVLADDLVIWREGHLLAGPRGVDLRARAASVLGVARPLGIVGSRERWRLDLPDVPSAVTFAGLIRLEWGPEPKLRPLKLDERLSLVLASAPIPVARQATVATLDLAAGSGVAWTRPKDWSCLRDSVRMLLDGLPSA